MYLYHYHPSLVPWRYARQRYGVVHEGILTFDGLKVIDTVDILDINLLPGLSGYCLHPSGANEFRIVGGVHSSRSRAAKCK